MYATHTAPTMPAHDLGSFKLDVTRRVYAVDVMTGATIAYFVRNFTIVG